MAKFSNAARRKMAGNKIRFSSGFKKARTARENPESCKNNGICKVQRKLYKVQKFLADEMSKITFQDVLEGK